MSKRINHSLCLTSATAFLLVSVASLAQSSSSQYGSPQPATAQASPSQPRCPWLNAATAGGVMGGKVEMIVTGPPEPTAATPSDPMYPSDGQRKDRLDTACEFHRQVNSVDYVLEIKVKTLTDPAKEFEVYRSACQSKVSLRGIGNEAYQCTPPAGSKEGTEEIVSLVRNRAFIFIVQYAPSSSAPAKSDGLRLDTRNIAEQIAGSLF